MKMSWLARGSGLLLRLRLIPGARSAPAHTAAAAVAARERDRGVYGLHGLNQPDDFDRLAKRAMAKSEDIVRSLVAVGPGGRSSFYLKTLGFKVRWMTCPRDIRRAPRWRPGRRLAW